MCFKSKEHLEADCHVKVFVPLKLVLAHLRLNSDIRYSCLPEPYEITREKNAFTSMNCEISDDFLGVPDWKGNKHTGLPGDPRQHG